jgi:hypothetical protein
VDAAMKFVDIVTGFFSSATSKIVDSIGNAIDRNLTTDHERLQVEKEIRQIVAELEKQVLLANQLEQEELTKRLQADMASDSWLSKNIRPMTLIFVTVSVTTLSFWTIFGTLSPGQQSALTAWISLWTAVMLTVYGLYFGSRGLEKIATAISTKRADK